MTRGHILQLVLHGSILVILGMLFGFVYRETITRNLEPDIQRAWRVNHTFLVDGGALYIAIGAAGHILKLGVRASTIAVASLVISAYGFAIALFVAPLVGERGMEPTGTAMSVVIFVIFFVSSWLGIAGMAIVIWGAWVSWRQSSSN